MDKPQKTNKKVESGHNPAKSGQPAKKKVEKTDSKKGSNHFDFSKVELADITPYNKNNWVKLLNHKFEHLFTFVPNKLVEMSAGAAKEIIGSGDTNDIIQTFPLYYWCAGLHFPEFEAYLLQYRTVMKGIMQDVQSQYMSEWVTTRGELARRLEKFLEMFATHTKVPLNFEHEGKIALTYYQHLEKIIKNVEEAYSKQFTSGAWPNKQKEYYGLHFPEHVDSDVVGDTTELDEILESAPENENVFPVDSTPKSS